MKYSKTEKFDNILTLVSKNEFFHFDFLHNNEQYGLHY